MGCTWKYAATLYLLNHTTWFGTHQAGDEEPRADPCPARPRSALQVGGLLAEAERLAGARELQRQQQQLLDEAKAVGRGGEATVPVGGSEVS